MSTGTVPRARCLRHGVGGGGKGGRHRPPTQPAPILELAKQGNFEQIEEILTTGFRNFDAASWMEDCSLSKGSTCLQTFKGETILHLIMAYQPPSEVVDLLIRKIIQKRPGSVPEDKADMHGRTPLHVAVIHGCDIAVVDRLMNGVVSYGPALTKDSQLRLPLHWACANPKLSSKGRSGLASCGSRSKDSENMIRIIQALVKVYPHAVTMKDQCGMTPLDLAVKVNANKYALNILESTSEHIKSLNDVGYSNSDITENMSMLDIPSEVTSAPISNFNDDNGDDISSIGSRGASRHVRRYKKKRVSRYNLQLYEQIQL